MNLGQKNRAVGSTAMNVRSSRSHRYALSSLQNKYTLFGGEGLNVAVNLSIVVLAYPTLPGYN